jgi:hypothetical protein
VGTNIVAVIAIVAIVLLLLLALIAVRIDQIPARIFNLMKQERAREDNRAQTALLEAAALKVGPLIAGIRTHHDQFAASLQAQLAEADTRERIAERRALDASTYFEAASTLVGDLRGVRDDLSSLVQRTAEARVVVSEPSAGPGDPDPRGTVVPPCTSPAFSQVHAVAPPEAAPVLGAEPAMVAARLISRGGAGDARPAPRRAQTLSGLSDARRESPTPPPDDAVTLYDSSDFLLPDRPSDPEGERTRVGPRPTAASMGFPVLKPTLPSMKAIAPPTPRANPSVARDDRDLAAQEGIEDASVRAAKMSTEKTN